MTSTTVSDSPAESSNWPVVAARRLDAAIMAASRRALQYEYQLKELEDKLAVDLSNSRAIDGLLREVFSALDRNSRHVDRALKFHIPHIYSEIQESTAVLSELEQQLPRIKSQVAVIRSVYDSGRAKAQSLLADLEWLNLDWWERWRRIIFTSSSPVSRKWKVFMRFIFCICFVAFAWVVYIALAGAYRAHRHRLVWGDKLIS